MLDSDRNFFLACLHRYEKTVETDVMKFRWMRPREQGTLSEEKSISSDVVIF